MYKVSGIIGEMNTRVEEVVKTNKTFRYSGTVSGNEDPQSPYVRVTEKGSRNEQLFSNPITGITVVSVSLIDGKR